VSTFDLEEPMSRALTIVLVVLLASPRLAMAQQVAPSPDLWRNVAAKVTPGATVKLRLQDGTKLTAVLLQASDEAITIKPKTRVPVPPQRVEYTAIESIELEERGGIGAAKAAAIGIVSGVGAFLGMLLVFVATLD
jgi:hypothetical protein